MEFKNYLREHIDELALLYSLREHSTKSIRCTRIDCAQCMLYNITNTPSYTNELAEASLCYAKVNKLVSMLDDTDKFRVLL